MAIVLTLGLILGIGFIFFAEKQKKSMLKTGQTSPGIKNDLKKSRNAQDFLEFTDIKNGIIALPNDEYRLIVEVVGSINFRLLSEQEQDNIEANFRDFLRSLAFPVQFYVQTRPLDLNNEISAMQERLRALPPAMAEYGIQLASDMARWVGSRNILVKKNYIIIPYQHSDRNEATKELYRRKDVVVGGLSKWIDCKVLNTLEAAKVFHVFFNKNRSVSFRMEDAEDYGFTDLYVSRLQEYGQL